jgi:hypothetical protein
MTPEAFVDAILSEVLDSNVRFYREALEGSEEATDPYWIASRSFYSRLPAAEREVVIRMMQQSAVDTISNIFGILDGTSTLEAYSEDFKLTYGARGKKLNGDLQDLFLAQIEEREA